MNQLTMVVKTYVTVQAVEIVVIPSLACLSFWEVFSFKTSPAGLIFLPLFDAATVVLLIQFLAQGAEVVRHECGKLCQTKLLFPLKLYFFNLIKHFVLSFTLVGTKRLGRSSFPGTCESRKYPGLETSPLTRDSGSWATYFWAPWRSVFLTSTSLWMCLCWRRYCRLCTPLVTPTR